MDGGKGSEMGSPVGQHYHSLEWSIDERPAEWSEDDSHILEEEEESDAKLRRLLDEPLLGYFMFGFLVGLMFS